MTVSRGPARVPKPPSYAERLDFAVWLAQLTMGIADQGDLGVAIGKAANTVSKWRGKQPSFEQSRLLANAVGISASWLHDPALPEAVVPELFGTWLESRRAAERRPAAKEMLTGFKTESTAKKKGKSA